MRYLMVVWLIAACVLPKTVYGSDARAAAPALGEAQAWRILQFRVQQNNSPDDTVKLLEEFVNTYPVAERALRAKFAIAEALFQGGNYSKAEPYYRLIIEKRGKDYILDSLLRLGEIRYNLGDMTGARKFWDTVIKKAPRQSILVPEAMYGISLCQLHEGDFINATKTVRQLTATYPGYRDLPKVREVRSILALNQKNFREGAELLEGINTPAAAFYLGLIQFRQRHFLEAAESFQKLETMTAGQYAEVGAFLKAECFRAADNDALASDAYDQFSQRYPQSSFRAYAMLHRARALLKVGRSEDASRVYQEVSRMRTSKEVRALNMFLGAEISARAGNYAGAVDSLDEVLGWIGRDPSEFYVSLVMAKGYYLLQAGRYGDAEKLMHGFILRMPHHPMAAAAFMLLGNAAFGRREWDTAIGSYESAFLKYEYSHLSDVAMAMLLNSYFQAHQYQELVTNSNRILRVAGTQFATQDYLWRGYSSFLIGEAYYRLKLFHEASGFYEQAMRHPALSPLASSYLAWSRFHEDRYADAIRLAQKVIGDRQSSVADKASAHFLIAGCYFNRKEYDSAVDAFRNFRRLFPEDALVPESIYQEGWAQRQAGYVGDALDSWKRLVAKYPRTSLAQDAQMEIGQLYFQGRKYKESAAAFAQVMALWPKTQAAVDAHWLFAQSFFNSRQDDAAIKAYESFLIRYPEDYRSKDAVKQLMQVRYRRASEAQDPQLLAEFVRQYPKSDQAPDAQYQLAQILFEQKDYPQAMEEYRKLVLNYPGASEAPMALLTIARIQERLGHKADALKEYESLTHLFPASPVAIDAAMRLGSLYFSDQKFDDASRSFRFVQEREAPADVKNNAIYNLAVSYKKGRYFDQALIAFQQFVDAYPKDTKTTDAGLEIASIYRINEQWEKAAAAYQAVLGGASLAPSAKMGVYNQLGEIYQKMENPDKAIESYRHLVGMSPLNADERLLGLAQLAALYEGKGAWPEALKAYAHISRSGGRRDWVQAATKRMREVRTYLRSQVSEAK